MALNIKASPLSAQPRYWTKLSWTEHGADLLVCWIYARDWSTSSLNKFPSRSIYDHLFHPDCQDFHAFLMSSLDTDPLVPHCLSSSTLFIRTITIVVHMWQKKTKQTMQRTQSHWWHMVEYNASSWLIWPKMRLKMKNSTMTSDIHQMSHLLTYKTMPTGVYTMQLAQFIFTQWSDNSGSKFLFSVRVTEKE